MNLVRGTLLALGILTAARGLYALVGSDITDEGETLEGSAARRYGAILVVIGLAIAAHAVFELPWVNAAIAWLSARDR